MLSRNIPITAILVYNDLMAAGVLSALEDNHITVPAEISVVGFDNMLISQFVNPKLTTINYPIKMMAKQAAELSLKCAKKEKYIPNTHVFYPTLVERGSVRDINSKIMNKVIESCEGEIENIKRELADVVQ